ncbi:DUF1168-domain-containing protein [Hygrophoropsis aurantiaca]|uniref:DUF1168-domain-containing protein n=1 Tax=Hygrophoropsis aurantiaca TaxID=72124 RepID=A0ACB8AME4_9AGAM|nr:DUF1168-domain-containing protein [Hygrophoropsis aurantiaca]
MSTPGTPGHNSQSPTPGPVNRHALTPVERQRSQLDRLLKDPSKLAYVPAPAKEKTIRPAREMMKNVQGSSAGAGSGEFHVYKASRRREYERLKMMEDASRKEVETEEFERKRREAEELAEAKTAKNRAKRQKKKERAKTKPAEKDASSRDKDMKDALETAPLKKRRLVNGKELVFRRPGEDSDDDETGGDNDPIEPAEAMDESISLPVEEAPRAIEQKRILIHEDD